MKLSTAWKALFATGFVLAGAAAASESYGDAEITLVRLTPDPGRIQLTARMQGALEVRNGCVHLVAKQSKQAVLVIWPSTYGLWRSNGRIVGVMDASTGKSLKFGVDAAFGGGGADGMPATELLAPIPPACDARRVVAYFAE